MLQSSRDLSFNDLFTRWQDDCMTFHASLQLEYKESVIRYLLAKTILGEKISPKQAICNTTVQ